jgi:multidrug efflux pump subunit AcrA (membrane-fusion protein)
LRKYFILFICFAAAFAAALNIKNISARFAPAVEVMALEPSDIRVTVPLSGTIRDSGRVEVASEMPVVPARLFVKAGDRVEKGQTLLIIDKAATSSALSVEKQKNIQTADPESGESVSVPQIPAEITAPESGTVKLVNAAAGNAVSGVLFVLQNGPELEAAVNISENLISRVAVGQKAVITGNGFKGAEYTGTLQSLEDAAKKVAKTTGSEVVVGGIIRIDNPDSLLRAGYSANIELLTDSAQNVLVLPYEAVGQDKDGREFCYVLKGEWAFLRYIETTRETQTGVEAASGVSAGDLIIINPEKLSGKAVRVNPTRS